MSIKVMTTVWDQSCHEGTTLLLLLALADHASDDGVCWPGIPRLARKTRKTERHTKRLLTKLEESGEIYVARGAGRGNTNMYYITLGFSEDEMMHTLIKRFDFDPDKAAWTANQIVGFQRKGDIHDTFSDIKDDIKGDTQGQEKVTPRAEKVTPTSKKGDIAMSPEPSLTIIKPSVENQEKNNFSEKIKKPDPLSFDLDRQTLNNKEGNYATPAPAGGDSSAADAGLLALYEAKGSEAPRRGSAGYIEQAEKIAQVLQDCTVTDPAIARLASQLLVEDKPGMANPYYRPFPAEYADYLGRVKRQIADDGDRRTADIEATEDSLAALESRRAARSPPPEDDEMGQGVKATLERQMGRNEFRQYVKPSGFICDDGVLRITAPNVFTRDWLENRLAVTVKRALAGVAGGPVTDVIFE